MKRLLALLLVAVLAVGGWVFAAPYWTLYRMREAFAAGDDRAFNAYVDYPAVRQSLANSAGESLPIGDGALSVIGRRLVGIAAERGLEKTLSADTVAVLIAGASPRLAAREPTDREAVRQALADLDIDRDMSGFTLSYRGSERARFTRQGLGYRLTAISPPSSRAELLDMLNRP